MKLGVARGVRWRSLKPGGARRISVELGDGGFAAVTSVCISIIIVSCGSLSFTPNHLLHHH